MIGQTGWNTLPFTSGVDAVVSHPNGHYYFFKGRQYVRWTYGEGTNELYPRRIGFWNRKHAGWPGLSSLVAKPCTTALGATSASIWLWLAEDTVDDGLTFTLNQTAVTNPVLRPAALGSQGAAIRSAMKDATYRLPGGRIMTLDLSGLEPGTDYALKIKRRDGGKVIETVEFRTAPPARSTGTVRFVLGSCANSTIQKRVDTFDAIAREQPDFAILCGDNGSYYYNGNLSATSEPYTGGSDFPDDDDRHRVDDWDSVPLMLKRQLKARNHPQFVNVAGKVPLFTTWDDHDCGYNNVSAALNAKFPNWVGMHKAASVYRAMWTHGYRNPDDLYYHFRWGPVHVFMTDGRFYRDSGAVLGRDQLDCLIADLEASEAPLKIVVSGNVVLHDHKEFLPAAEKDRLLEELRRPERGRVLLLSGDVHFSECNYDDAEGRVLVEVTSSPLQLKASDKKSRRDTDTGPHRLWQTRVSDQPKLVGTYALIEVNIRAATGTSIEDGEVKVTARGRNGAVLANDDGAAKCHTYWDLATGEVRLGE